MNKGSTNIIYIHTFRFCYTDNKKVAQLFFLYIQKIHVAFNDLKKCPEPTFLKLKENYESYIK